MISIIVAMARNRVIGRNNSLIWHLPADLKYFKKTTMGRPVIMGRKTFESVGKPLPGRTNIIVTRREGYFAEGCLAAGSLEEAIEMAKSPGSNAGDSGGSGPETGRHGNDQGGSGPETGRYANDPGGSGSGSNNTGAASEIFIAGGGEIYSQAMGIADRIYITRVHADFEGDTLFPPIPEREWKLTEEMHHPADERNKYPMTFRIYDRK
ncbi:MAG: dihydrofolate reductase [Marinilabiliales bacterium]|nr:MAG: dihydrofolate reductase [Marinilabiliales bacterium]